MNWLREHDLNMRPLGYEPKLDFALDCLGLPCVPLHAPKSLILLPYVALECLQLGNSFGDM